MSHILIVDDDEHVRISLSLCLERAGFEVSQARDGEEALKINDQRRADLIILDLLMPGKEGLETIMALRKEENRPRVIAISGGSNSISADFLPTALKLGADKALKKPFRNDELIDAVNALLQPNIL
mgnify:CR=1 FL=1